MGDGRVLVILAIAFLYIGLGIFCDFSFSSFGSPAKTAYLHSMSPEDLVVDASPAHDHELAGHALPAVHAPFFFQAIPINSADKEILMTVKGIGPALADSILAHRQNVGPLLSLDDLAKIPGMGKKRAATLATFLFFDEVP